MTTATITTEKEQRCFGGVQGTYTHASAATGTTMRFAVYQPPQAAEGPRPALIYLSGLTCTEENVSTKAGAQRYAAEHGLVFVAPDTSPRGEGVADDPAYDLGVGAGFYVDATREPWAPHYRMYSYIVDELPALLAARFPIRLDALGITGHSMGGHGALVLGLRNPDRFRSISALAPIVAPTEVPWGHKALAAYLGDDRDAWRRYDACALVRERSHPAAILIDQGEADGFLAEQLRPELFASACAAGGQALELRRQPGYDHSYYFIASFIGDHIAHHAAILGA
ncbi:MAG: S-formylglutathione hydrolase [Nannocystaceae bacterium]